MYKPLLAGPLALALVLAYTANVSANPENEFCEDCAAKADSKASADARGGNGGDANASNGDGNAGGIGGDGGGALAIAISESFNESTEVISRQDLSAYVTGAAIVIKGGKGGSGGWARAGDTKGLGGNGGDANANNGDGNAGGIGGDGDLGVGASVALAGGGGDGGDANLTTGDVTVSVGAGSFVVGAQNVSSGLYNAQVGGVSIAAHAAVNMGGGP